MITIALIVAAALVLGGKDLVAKGRELVAGMPVPEISVRHVAAALLLVAALVYWQRGQPDGPEPAPPAPAGPLDLRGLFVGPTAASDAILVGALCGELAAELQWDGTQAEPFFRTAIAIDELRQRTRELRCRGESIGSRQTSARDAIASHLERAVGTSGGPITPEQRAAWVAAFRDIERAAANVTR
jgi:hypothetical protein